MKKLKKYCNNFTVVVVFFFSSFTFFQVNIKIVEIDPAILNVAKKYFSYADDDTQQCIIKDGKIFLQESVQKGLCFAFFFFAVLKKGKISFFFSTSLVKRQKILKPLINNSLITLLNIGGLM